MNIRLAIGFGYPDIGSGYHDSLSANARVRVALMQMMYMLAILCVALLNLVFVQGAADDPKLPKLNNIFHGTGTVVVDVGDSTIAGTCMPLAHVCLLACCYNSLHYLQL